MKQCISCIMPDTKPDLTLDEEGVCSACRASEQKIDDIAQAFAQIGFKVCNKTFNNFSNIYITEF